MPHILLRNISKVPIGGMHPGRVFRLETDHQGVPLDLNWQIRLRDEAPTGHLVPFDPDYPEGKPAPASAPASPPPPDDVAADGTDQQKD